MSQSSEPAGESSQPSERESLPIEQASLSDTEAPHLSSSPDPSDALGKLPPDQQNSVLEFYSASMQLSGPMANPLLSKLEPEHITGIIGLASRTVDAEASDRKHSRLFWFATLFLLVGAALAVLLTLAIIGENDLFLEVVKLLAVGIGGFGGGYGLSTWRSRN